MTERKTARSKIVEYESAECTHCGDKVFIDQDMENVDSLPEGINVVIGGGNHIKVKVNQSGIGAHHRVPRIVTKWFVSEDEELNIERQYICLPCARAVYGFSK